MIILMFIQKANLNSHEYHFDYIVIKKDELRLLARLLESECSICPISDKKLVGATVLNRIGHSDFPDNMRDVINQPNQFALKKIKPSKESLKVALDLLINNRNKLVLYFYKPGHGFKRKNILIKTKYHHYAT